jgi:hypothetical protein
LFRQELDGGLPVQSGKILSVQQKHGLSLGSTRGLDVTVGHAQSLVLYLQLEKFHVVLGLKCLDLLRK